MLKSHFAYNTMPEIEAVMRLQAVKRWHMIETTRTQTLAEHTANVAILATTIARTAPVMFFQTATVALGALVHDLSEAFLGDIPTHTKRLMQDLSSIEASVLTQAHSQLILKGGSPESRLLKLCDIIDGIRFIRIHGVDVTAKHAQEGLEEQLAQRLGEVALDWPLEVFHHVVERLSFYGYEKTGAFPPARFSESYARELDADLA
jgi:5'-deoxynucleotidase YfbR-like HD superfamily hydrolase